MSGLTSRSTAASPIFLAESLHISGEDTIARPLKVGGITPFSATDYPGQLAAVVFVQGCPWRCGYCHNPHLQNRTEEGPVAWTEVLALLRRRVGLIDAVVFSGGEPTMDPALPEAILEVRGMGYCVGLHTAGMYPRRFAEVLPLVDWVGMDIKAAQQGYDTITGIQNSARAPWASAEILLSSGVAHEFRTTIHPGQHSESEILGLANTLSTMGVRNYALQVFRNIGCHNEALKCVSTTAYPNADLIPKVRPLFEHFVMRRE